MSEVGGPEIRVERADSTGAAAAGGEDRRLAARAARPAPEADVRDEDLEPHEGLRYVARLFKVLAILLLLMLVFELIIGIVQQGADAIPTLVVEATRLIVFAGLLWGIGDIALMLIESNHDLRATRILMGRLNTKLQRLTDLEADDIERRAANPSLRGQGPAGD